MRKFLLSFFFSLMAHTLFCQTVIISKYNTPVNVYKNAIDDSVRYCIMQDTISDIYYYVQILESSPLRFKVQLSYSDGPTSNPDFIGWIDKQNCVVYSRYYHGENNSQYIKLYKEPNASSPFEIIYVDFDDSFSILFNVIEFSIDVDSSVWYKTCFYYRNKLYVGWIDKYCSIIYDSCT